VHDWRHYAKLRPVLACHQRLLNAYRTDSWALYRSLQAYREAPTADERARLYEGGWQIPIDGDLTMSQNSAIEWTDSTWNPVTGCTEVSPGCDHCYARTFAERFH